MNPPIVLSGKSMMPTLRPGAKLILAQIERPIEVGDIVVANLQEEWIAHRVIEISYNTYLLKGDRSPHIHQHLELLSVVQGYEYDGSTVVWGPKGQSLKKALANLSKVWPQRPYWQRKMIRILFHLIGSFSNAISKLGL